MTVLRMVACLAASIGFASGGFAADPAQLAEGMRVYRTVGGCETCHSWLGENHERHDGADWMDIPPSLVKTALGREQMIELVACGTPGGEMPQYLAAAWTERRRCYGKVLADLPAQIRPPKPYNILSQSQIEAVVDFVQSVYRGRGMTLEDCLVYWGDKPRACDLFR